MNKKNHTTSHMTTPQLANRFGVKPETVRHNLCTKGHFLGIRPIKLPNGRLLWPDVTPEEITNNTATA